MILEKIKTYPDTVQFNEVIEHIDNKYDFIPTKFKNGEIVNEENQNNGSCKLFSFAKLHNLSQEETLHLFGDFYREEVLKKPMENNHLNIRNFIKYGWEGILFEDIALKEK
ncbi:HopJ type III effector protein [Apibacter raozihei]|uniref:HopJ type III effector protein n=1 Tax=Apibacter raozihei TaxID=2500547 RepID=UPI000FE42032|nr:HopJ type III effector protein [Apibacter raozihei]